MANTIILKGIYTRKSRDGPYVDIPFLVQHSLRKNEAGKVVDEPITFFLGNNENPHGFKFKEVFKLTRITGGVPVEISDDKVDYKGDKKEYIFFGDTKVESEKIMPYRDRFFRVTPNSYDHFLKNILDKEIPWENVKLNYDSDNMIITCSLEGIWKTLQKAADEDDIYDAAIAGRFPNRGGKSKHTHRKPTKRRRNRRGNRKTKKN